MGYPEFVTYLKSISQQISQWEDVVQILYNKTNPDAIIASAIIARTFYDSQQPCMVSEYNEDAEFPEDRGIYNTILFGIKHEVIGSMNIQGEILSFCSDQVDKKKGSVTHINPVDYDIGSQDCGLSASCYLMAKNIITDVKPIICLPLVAFHTINLYQDYDQLHQEICNETLDLSLIETRKDLSFLGSTIFSIPETITYSLNPFLPTLSGNENGVNQLLAKTGIEIETKSHSRNLSDLSKEENRDLNSGLIRLMETLKGHKEDQLVFIRTNTIFSSQQKDTIAYSVWDFSMAIIDSLNRNELVLAFEVLFGNRGAKLNKLQRIFIEERKAIPLSYQLLYDHRDEFTDLAHMRYYETDRKIKWFNSSVTAGIVLSNGLATPDKPFAIISPGPGDQVTIGLRASKSHKLRKPLIEISEEIKETQSSIQNISGSTLSVQISLIKESLDNVLLEVNSKLGEYR